MELTVKQENSNFDKHTGRNVVAWLHHALRLLWLLQLNYSFVKNLKISNCQFFHDKQEQFEVQKAHRSKDGCHGNLMFLDQSNNQR